MNTFVIVVACLLMVLCIESSPVPEPRGYGYGGSSESHESSEEYYPRQYGGRRDFLDFGSVGINPRYSGYNGNNGYNGYNGYNRNSGYNNNGYNRNNGLNLGGVLGLLG